MTANALLKKASLTCLVAAVPAWAAIPLTGPCDPDFGTCQATPKENKAASARPAKASAPVNATPAPPAPGKAPAAKAAAEPRAESPSTSGEETGRSSATELPEHSTPLVPALQLAQ